MPIYEFRCRKNSHQITRLLRVSDIDQPQHCHCGSLLIQQYSVPQLMIFKSFVTRNIMADGSPVEVRSASHQAELCRRNGMRPSPLRDYKKDIAARKTVQGSISEVKDRLKAARKIIKEVSPDDLKLGESYEPVRGSIAPEMVERRERERIVEP